ncbi:MAG: polysaccharide biosynthesis protein [Promethearchaeota archaeon]
MNFLELFQDKIFLILGGTGSIGSEIVSQLLNYNPKTIRILSNSEDELWKTKLRFQKYDDKLRYLLGDIRNYERLERATEDVNFVFNTAAIKHVPISEYNPMEAINVNIHGLENIVEASISCGVDKLIHISSDKAVNPTTVMGATKMLGERLCVSRELAKGEHSTIISCVRFGNVLGSRGSIIPLIKNQIRNGNNVTLTDEKMRRFFLSLSQAVKLVLKAALLAKGGEIFVLKMPVILIKDLIEVMIEEYAPKIGKEPSLIKIETIGVRPGEKFHEELISPIEFSVCKEIDDMYCIYPLINFDQTVEVYSMSLNGSEVLIDEKNFHYSTENVNTLTKDQIKKLLKEINLI